MIRVGTMIWLGLIGASSAFLFKTSYEVQSLQGDLRGLNRSILREQDSIRVMHAEWAFLNQPSRLQALSDQFTKLRPIAPMQMIASAADLPMPQPSLDGEPMASTASLVAQIDALPSFGPVPLPGHRPGEGGVLLAAAAPMPVQIPAASPQPAAPVQMAAVEVRPAPVVAPIAAPVAAAQPPAAAPPVTRVAAADVPIRPVVAPRRPATAPLEAMAQALTPTRAAASDDPIGALLSGLEAPRGIR